MEYAALNTKRYKVFHIRAQAPYHLSSQRRSTPPNPITMQKLSRICKYIFVIFVVVFVIAMIIAFIVLPFAFKNSEHLQEVLMFTNVWLPTDAEYYNKNIYGVRNFYIDFEDYDGANINLGVWHILPMEIIVNSTTGVFNFDEALRNSNYNVVIHFHGSGMSRADSIPMFSILYQFFHVIAFDYRGYGDSTKTKEMSEYAIARDSEKIYNWVRNKTSKDIYIWSHSLGTPLSTLTINYLKKNNIVPTGLILESALTNMREEIPVHNYGKLFAWLPYFNYTILDPLDYNGFKFNNSKYIMDVDCPVMMLHSADDSVIPVELGRKLYRIAVEGRKSYQGNVSYHEFPAQFGYDHFRIYESPDLPILIEHFMNKSSEFKRKRTNG